MNNTTIKGPITRLSAFLGCWPARGQVSASSWASLPIQLSLFQPFAYLLHLSFHFIDPLYLLDAIHAQYCCFINISDSKMENQPNNWRDLRISRLKIWPSDVPFFPGPREGFSFEYADLCSFIVNRSRNAFEKRKSFMFFNPAILLGAGVFCGFFLYW